MLLKRECSGRYTAVTGHLLVQQGNINVRDEFPIFMVHYAGINHITSNEKGQNNILGHATHTVTLKLKIKKTKSKQKTTKTKKDQKIVKSFLERAYFSCILISELAKTWQIAIFQYFL